MSARGAKSVPGVAPAAARPAQLPGLDAGQNLKPTMVITVSSLSIKESLLRVCGGRERGSCQDMK